MAFFNETQSARPSALESIATFFRNLGSSVDLAASSKARVRKMERLNSLSDEELAAKGLRREDIARHVFNDVLFL